MAGMLKVARSSRNNSKSCSAAMKAVGRALFVMIHMFSECFVIFVPSPKVRFGVLSLINFVHSVLVLDERHMLLWRPKPHSM